MLPAPHPPTVLLLEHSAGSYCLTAESCKNQRPDSNGRQAERTGGLLLLVDRMIQMRALCDTHICE
jgi:hypothetical protein